MRCLKDILFKMRRGFDCEKHVNKNTRFMKLICCWHELVKKYDFIYREREICASTFLSADMFFRFQLKLHKANISYSLCVHWQWDFDCTSQTIFESQIKVFSLTSDIVTPFKFLSSLSWSVSCLDNVIVRA